MLKTTHTLIAHMPSRFRAHRERLEQHYEPRWRTCVRELIDHLALPLYGFSFQQLESLDYSTVSRREVKRENMRRSEFQVAATIARSKEQIAKHLRTLQWIDEETRQQLLQNVHNLRVVANLLSSVQAEDQVRAAYAGETLSDGAYFDNVLTLRQANAR